MSKYRINQYNTRSYHVEEADRLSKLIHKELISPPNPHARPNTVRDLNIQFGIHVNWLKENSPDIRFTHNAAWLGFERLFDIPRIYPLLTNRRTP